MPDADPIERHVDLVAGVGAFVWAVGATLLVPVDPTVPTLAEFCSPAFAVTFGLAALGRWYRKLAKRRQKSAAA